MAGTYLSKRKRNDHSINFYAVTNIWNPEKKRQDKKQIFIGTFLNGHCRFNEKAIEYADLFKSTEYEHAYWLWRESREAEQKRDSLVRQESIVDAEIKNAGLDLLLSHVVQDLKLDRLLERVFGESLAQRILSLAYYCAFDGRQPLSRMSVWFEDQLLPWEHGFSLGMIEKTLVEIAASDILKFQQAWMKQFAREDRLSLDITSVSSYSQNSIPDVSRGYNRDRENLPQINLLMLVSQRSRLPLWFEQLPGAIADITTIKDTIRLLKELDDTPRSIVFDRGFADQDNIKCLMDNHIKFTMGIPLWRFQDVRDEIDQARQEKLFNAPSSTLSLFEPDSVYQTQGITKLKKINGHRVYLHLYYTDFYHSQTNLLLMQDLVRIEQMLKSGQELKSASDIELAKKCFTVKKTPVRGIQVKENLEAIEQLRNSDSGYFAIFSTEFKDAEQAMFAYKLRDGIEKRFDDLKNEEDMHRIRVHSTHNLQSRLFIQFIAQILRCYILSKLQSVEVGQLSKVQSVTDLLWNVASLRRVHVEGHRPFYKRPTKTQREIFTLFGIPMDTKAWPSML